MKAILSPAKTLDYSSALPIEDFTQPIFMDESTHLNGKLKELKASDLRELMGISAKLADLNQERNLAWKAPFTAKNARPAILAFKGDVYQGFDAYSMKKRDFTHAQKTVRILSGLYGVLKPLDLMQAYRLEMGTKLKVSSAIGDLYRFWGSKVTDALNEEFAAEKKPVLVNLASNEYYKVIQPSKIEAEIVTPVFKDWKNGEYKMISFFAKKARGMMARYIVDHRVKKAEDLQGFDYSGYVFNSEMSSDKIPTFTRLQQP